jgi:hypothetical protein
MEGPAALSSFYVTLAHEYGFSGSNLMQLLQICGFSELRFIDTNKYQDLKSRLVRAPYLFAQRIKLRLFGVNRGGQFGAELMVVARRSTNSLKAGEPI